MDSSPTPVAWISPPALDYDKDGSALQALFPGESE